MAELKIQFQPLKPKNYRSMNTLDYRATLGDPGLATQSKEFSIKALQKRAFNCLLNSMNI
ncbi:MAG: hypothetical protein CMC35_09360 [Flavobacteriaceae bacterium]|nr:hypothetical protein [Flavobacteriaceae bacterium]|tara:strand:+ start:8503 stop:8682 length:180 start_codon:yes stop_codon:yes gene_type:complete